MSAKTGLFLLTVLGMQNPAPIQPPGIGEHPSRIGRATAEANARFTVVAVAELETGSLPLVVKTWTRQSALTAIGNFVIR